MRSRFISLWVIGTMLMGCSTVPTVKSTAPTQAKKGVKPAEKVDGYKAGARPVVRGEGPDVKVSIIAFSDFECPYCARANGTLELLLRDYAGHVQVVFMHNPLPFHQYAFDAAVLSMVADKKGKFWAFHDQLFEAKARLSKDVITKALASVGLSLDGVKHLFTPEIPQFVARSIAVAKDIGDRGTPTFYVNGKRLAGAQPYDAFKGVIDKEIAAADAAKKKGRTWIRSRLLAQHAKLYGYMYGGKNPPKPAPAPKIKKSPVPKTVFKVPVSAHDPVKGDQDKALVTVITFSDYECSYCKRLEAVLKKLKTTFGSELRLVAKQLPLSFHSRARPAARAALCAKEQGQFWAYHDMLFTHTPNLANKDLLAYATTLKLKVEPFKHCLKNGKVEKQIQADEALAERVAVRGTPNTFVNGRLVSGARAYEVFEVAVKEELAKAKKVVASGIAINRVYDHMIRNGKTIGLLSDKVRHIDIEGAAAQGDPKKAVMTVVVFSDYQCPYCAKVDPILEKAKKRLGSKMALVFKHYPLSFHRMARPASKAAICAQEQGKFWEMSGQIFAHQPALSEKNLRIWAKGLTLDMKRFDTCYKSADTVKRIKKDMADGDKVGVGGTPTVYINGREATFRGGVNPDYFAKVLRTLLKAKKTP